MEANGLRLDFTNITLEPYSTLSVDNQILPSVRHVGDGKAHASGSSGAGHGGHGGVGSGQNLVGISYGSFRIPRSSGRPGAAPVFPRVPGYGGGSLELIAQSTIHIDGTISARGGPATSPRGSGASGGSILVYGNIFTGKELSTFPVGMGTRHIVGRCWRTRQCLHKC